MPAPTRIHHINFLVRDLEAARDFYETALGLPPFEVIQHELRGSKIARSKVGETWFVLVCPDDDTSVPGRYLKQHGEGFFLLSFGVDDLDHRLSMLDDVGRDAVRQGILDWRIADVGSHFGALIQLADDDSA